MRLIDDALAAGRSVAVDDTNPSPDEWRPLIAAARGYGATAVAYWFPPDLPAALTRNAARTGRKRVPDVGVLATFRRLRRPYAHDGFDRRYTVHLDGSGGFRITPMVGDEE